ncbi:endonuclease domain-containing protein [Actinomyces bowdenii]|uniref:endonuclease domain-containing protein n=1 Tax=Actinomyces bowdenii TaxID=131109 RepID=UPI00214C90CE|nr:endonuclease domain-containing protein [Actinomyces bowdenii]MCR2051848.1 endonuclease domain-containing protein [Actinomyces bowdenii]
METSTRASAALGGISADIHHPLDRSLLPRLVRTGRSVRAQRLVSVGARASRPGPGLRLAPGILWVPHEKASRWQHQYTLCLARAITAQATQRSMRCLSHTSAALILGLPMMSREPDVYVAVPSRPRQVRTPLPLIGVPSSGLPRPLPGPGRLCRQVSLWRRQLDLTGEEIAVVNGMAVTSALRTAFDCACDEPAHNALVIADAALRLVCRPQRRRPWAHERTEAMARRVWEGLFDRHPRRRGISQARAVLAAATPMADSPGESAARWLSLALGLTPPRPQYLIETRRGQYWVDLCWPEQGIVIEVDGQVKYESPQDLWEEKRRQDAIQAQGWTVMRITYEEFYDLLALSQRIESVFPAGAVTAAVPAAGMLWPGRGLDDGLPEGSMLAAPRG